MLGKFFKSSGMKNTEIILYYLVFLYSKSIMQAHYNSCVEFLLINPEIINPSHNLLEFLKNHPIKPNEIG